MLTGVKTHRLPDQPPPPPLRCMFKKRGGPLLSLEMLQSAGVLRQLDVRHAPSDTTHQGRGPFKPTDPMMCDGPQAFSSLVFDLFTWEDDVCSC